MDKIINRYYKRLWLKSTCRFKERSRIPSNASSKTLDVVKKKWNLANVANFSLGWFYNDESKHIPTKSRKSIDSWSNQICNPSANVSVKVQHERISNLKPDQQIKKTQSEQPCTNIHQLSEVKVNCIQFPSVMSQKFFSTRSKSCTYLKMLTFFLSSAGQNYVSDTKRDTND